MKNLFIIAAITLVSGVSGFLMSTPNNPGHANSRNEVNSPIKYQGERVDSLQAEIHNDSILLCKARLREDSLRGLPKLAFNR